MDTNILQPIWCIYSLIQYQSLCNNAGALACYAASYRRLLAVEAAKNLWVRGKGTFAPSKPQWLQMVNSDLCQRYHWCKFTLIHAGPSDLGRRVGYSMCQCRWACSMLSLLHAEPEPLLPPSVGSPPHLTPSPWGREGPTLAVNLSASAAFQRTTNARCLGLGSDSFPPVPMCRICLFAHFLMQLEMHLQYTCILVCSHFD